jgi:hypothetical protein
VTPSTLAAGRENSWSRWAFGEGEPAVIRRFNACSSLSGLIEPDYDAIDPQTANRIARASPTYPRMKAAPDRVTGMSDNPHRQ